MSDRMLRADLFKSDRFLTLPDAVCRLAFVACVADADDLGNFEAQPGQLRRLWIAADVAALDDVERIVKALGAVDLVRWYTELSTGKRYGHIPRFRQRLRSIKRAHPRPPSEVECNEIKELISKLPDNGQTIDRRVSDIRQSIDASRAPAEVKGREVKGIKPRAHPPASPPPANALTASRSAPPSGFFEKVNGQVNGKNPHAVTPLAGLVRGNWRANQGTIAAMAAHLELRPQPGETFAQLADRCDAELARRKASEPPAARQA